MFYRIELASIIILFFLTGCTPAREITYSIKGVKPFISQDSQYITIRNVNLNIEPFEDIRQSIPENGILFVRERETDINGKASCINAEEHYKSKKNTVAGQIAAIMAKHFGKRETFKSVTSGSSEQSEYILTGKLRRFYGEQEFSSAARAGSMFGLIGALATSGAATKGNIIIEFTDLAIKRKSDGAVKKLEDMNINVSSDLHADAYCWCIYDNINDQLKSSVENFAPVIERAVADLISSKQ